MGAQHSQPTRPTAPAADVTQPCPTQSAQQPQPPTDSEPLQLPTDVFDYFLASVSDPELLSQLSRVSKRANATVTRCHKPIIVHLTHSQRADPQQAAEQLCSKAAETQCKRLRFVGDWQEIDVKAWMGERVAASLVEVGNVLSQAPAQVALQNITTLELKGLRLETLVPSWLPTLCPHITILMITHCKIVQLPPADHVFPTCPNIRCLVVRDLYDCVTYYNSQNLAIRAVRDTLGAFPGLCELVWEWVPNGLESLVQRRYQDWPWAPVPAAIPHKSHATLTRLDLPWVQLSDADVEVLLSMSVLRDIGFGSLRLTQDYSQRGCQWEQLTCGRLQADQLARLPLQSLRTLRLRCEDVTGCGERPQVQRCVRVWVDKPFTNTAHTLALTDTIEHTAKLVLLAPSKVPIGSDTELIISTQCFGHGQWFKHGPDVVTHMAAFEAFWSVFTRSLPDAPHTITYQLRESQHCTPEFLFALTQALKRSTPQGVSARFRIELWECWFPAGEAKQLLFVTSGLPLVMTVKKSGVSGVIDALTYAPPGGPPTKLTVQLSYQTNRHAMDSPERRLLEAVTVSSSVQCEVVLLFQEIQTGAVLGFVWQASTGVQRVLGWFGR